MGREEPIWRKILRTNFRSWKELFLFLEIPIDADHGAIEDKRFPLNLPRRLAEKIEKGRLDDPILRQFLPTREELVEGSSFSSDPLEEKEFMRAPKLIQKYKGRLLLLPTSACAMHCRFCFRRHFPYERDLPGWQKEIEVVKKDTSLEEVILSGGDPLSLTNEQLQEIFDSLMEISHIKRLRIHTRFPIGIPERIDHGFLSLVKKLKVPLYIMIHSNHPRELDETIGKALSELRQAGAVLMNHSVLLKGVNDSVDTLEALSQELLKWGVIPYYLNQLDRVQGAAHFEVAVSEGVKLSQALLERLPGMGMPRYVKESPGALSKTPLI